MKCDFLLTFTRNIARHSPKRWKKDVVSLNAVPYYPRRDEKDSVRLSEKKVTPTKLLMVQRVKPYMGNPYWEKDVLDAFGIGYNKKTSEITIVKNIPEVCAMLWKVKHLIKVTPIQLPENMPDENNLDGYWLHETGKVYNVPKVDLERYNSSLNQASNPKKFDTKTIKERLRLQWVAGFLPV